MSEIRVQDLMQGAAATWEVYARLEHHTRVGGILEGLKVDAEGTLKIDGFDDLPLCQPSALFTQEGLSAGAPRKENNQTDRINQPVTETLTLTYRIATARKFGWVRLDPRVEEAPKGLIEWVSLIRDAIETSRADGSADSSLCGTLMKPPTFRIRESSATQLSFECFLEIELELRHKCRAERRLAIPE